MNGTEGQDAYVSQDAAYAAGFQAGMDHVEEDAYVIPKDSPLGRMISQARELGA